MQATRVKYFRQGVSLSGGGPASDGVCYYLCNYVESKIWCKQSYEECLKAVDSFVPDTAIKYAKSQNVQFYRQKSYNGNLSMFSSGVLYRIELCTYSAGNLPTAPNHELIMVTGPRDRALFFDPNFGFYELVENGGTLTPAAFENYLDTLYRPGWQAGGFGYQLVRRLSERVRLSFETRR